MPQPSPELVALSNIPVLNVIVTNTEGNKLNGAFVNYRNSHQDSMAVVLPVPMEVLR
jgi:hypothetical protein